MSLVDIDQLSIGELREFIEAIATRINFLENQEVGDKEAARRAIIEARSILETLRGPEGSEPNTESVRGVLAFGTEVITANSATATPLIFHALEVLTSVMIQITKVVNE